MARLTLPCLALLSSLTLLPLASCGGEAASNEGPEININVNKAGQSGKGGKGGSAGKGGSTSSGAGGAPAGEGGKASAGGAAGAAAGQGGAGSSVGAGQGGASQGGAGQAGSGNAGAGGQGGAPLPCDPRFSFSSSSLEAGKPFQVTFTDPAPFPWIAMEASGPGAPVVSDQVISGSGPYSWSYTVSGHQAGALELRFYKDKEPGTAGSLVATCQRQVQPGQGGEGGQGGAGQAGSGQAGSGQGGGPIGEACTTPIEMVSGQSGTYFVLDLNCPQLELRQSPIYGSAPGQTSYRSTLAGWLTDYNGDGAVAFAFNTNYSQTNADPITGAYVVDGAIYQTVFLTNCTDSGGCPTSCFLEQARYSLGVGADGKVIDLAYSPAYDWGSCQALGCQGCKDLNWNTNMPIKWPVGTNNGIIPPGTRWLVSGVDIETGVPSHNGKPDAFSEALGNRNVMARVKGKNRLVVGLLQSASRAAVKQYMTSTFDVGQISVYDGGGSTKQYISFEGKTLNIDGTRAVPGILGFRVK